VTSHETFGDWEGDPMISERTHVRANAASLIEQKTRFAVLFRNNDPSTKHLMNRLMDVMAPPPQSARRTITFDRGIEFQNRLKLKPGIGTEVWFSDPQTPWQKGSAQNLDKRAPVSAKRYAGGGALKSFLEGDLRPPERHTPKTPRSANPEQGVHRRNEQPEIAETVATTLQPTPFKWKMVETSINFLALAYQACWRQNRERKLPQ
jgi:hypothetical protein